MGLFEEIEKKGNVFKPKAVTKDLFDEMIDAMDNRDGNRELVMFGSANTNGYMTAVVNEDEVMVKHYQIKFTIRAFRELKALHDKMQGYGDVIYDVFCELEKRFERRIDHRLIWRSQMFMSPVDYLEPGEMEIVFDENTETFTMQIHQYSECGWDHKRTEMWVRVKPEELFDKL